VSGPALIQAVRPPTAAVIVMTCVDGWQHYVTEGAAVDGRRSGRYLSVCGCAFIPASLTTPDGAACRSCAVWAGDRS
jgi:hypothetical protein